MIATGFKFIDIERYNYESYDDYIERCYFIINNLKKGEYKLEELIEKSKFFYNIYKLKCKYNSNITDEINKMTKYAGGGERQFSPPLDIILYINII